MLILISKFAHWHPNLHQHHIFDLYCGFGITSLLLAQQGHRVTGIEYNKEAVKFAQENSNLNQLKNCRFILGDVEKIFPQWLKTQSSQLSHCESPSSWSRKESGANFNQS